MDAFTQEVVALVLVIFVALVALKKALAARQNSAKGGFSGCHTSSCEAKKPATTTVEVSIPSVRQ